MVSFNSGTRSLVNGETKSFMFSFVVVDLLSLIVIGTIAEDIDLSTRRSLRLEATLAQTKRYEITIPTLVNQSGKFLSYDVTYPEVLKRRRRNAATVFHGLQHIYYNVTILSRLLQLELAANIKLTSKNFEVEEWSNEGIVRKRRRPLSCFFHGRILSSPGSVVSLSNCYGLHGILTLGEDFYFIEPYWNHTKNIHKEGYPHIVFKSTNVKVPGEFYLNNDRNVKQFWTRRKRVRREIQSTSVQRYVETLVVADDKMFSYYGEKEIDPYILTIMNIVSMLYGDQSIGNAIDVVVTRLVLLTEKQPDLNITHHASDTLESFCNWQKSINTREVAYKQQEEGIAHHDNAILITRNDICYDKDEPCDTLGLGQVSGMCEPSRSCNINQDIGLISGFTIAHEMGHNFGMQHDGFGNNCAVGLNRSGHIMTTQLSQLVHPITWSPCSRRYITNFLDSGQGECLKNKPRFEEFDYPSFLPGELYSIDEQCQSQYGSLSTICEEAQEEPCEALWCEQPQGGCTTNHIPVLDGTPCNDTKVMSGWCHSGQCVTHGTKIEKVDGSWGKWSDWKDCSRSCGGGVEFSERLCNDPRPMNGGEYCIGHRKRFRICNNQDCPSNSEDFRAIQCSEFNMVEFRGKFYEWIPFTNGQLNPCALYCQAIGYKFYSQKALKVIDGTRCFPDTSDICIDGQCEHVGCDGILGSMAIEDRCRVCEGDGTACRTVLGFVNDSFENRQKEYVEIIRLPKGAVHIRIREKEESTNLIALKTTNGSYHLNGKKEVSWPMTYIILGTRFHYMRTKSHHEFLHALGPLSEELIVMLLLEEPNKGVVFSYNIPLEALSDQANTTSGHFG